MVVLQAYQADLLKDLDKGQGVSPDEVVELRCTTDLALHATKQAATAMGRSIVAMVVTERHLWVNLADIRKKEKVSMLQSRLPSFSVPPSRWWSRSLGRPRRSAAFKTFIPRRSRSEIEQHKGPSPSWAQKPSVATRAPPPPAGRARGRRGRQDLREVIQTRRSQHSHPTVVELALLHCMGYALRLRALFWGWLGPGLPWAPLYLFLPKNSGIEEWVITKGLLRQFPQRARAEQSVVPG